MTNPNFLDVTCFRGTFWSRFIKGFNEGKCTTLVTAACYVDLEKAYDCLKRGVIAQFNRQWNMWKTRHG